MTDYATDRSTISRNDRHQVWSQAAGRCQCCTTPITLNAPSSNHPDQFHLDHVLPLALGGRDDMTNWQALCGPCNLRKGATYADYRPNPPERWTLLVDAIRESIPNTPPAPPVVASWPAPEAPVTRRRAAAPGMGVMGHAEYLAYRVGQASQPAEPVRSGFDSDRYEADRLSRLEDQLRDYRAELAHHIRMGRVNDVTVTAWMVVLVETEIATGDEPDKASMRAAYDHPFVQTAVRQAEAAKRARS
jgi:hypothetical protein